MEKHEAKTGGINEVDVMLGQLALSPETHYTDDASSQEQYPHSD